MEPGATLNPEQRSSRLAGAQAPHSHAIPRANAESGDDTRAEGEGGLCSRPPEALFMRERLPFPIPAPIAQDAL